MFTDDPVNWLKWAVVFAILIGGYAVAVPLYKKVSHGVSWERKRDIAKSRDHIIKASLVDKHPSGEVSQLAATSATRSTGRAAVYCPFQAPGDAAPVPDSIMSMILTSSCFLQEYHLKTTRGCSCFRSSVLP